LTIALYHVTITLNLSIHLVSLDFSNSALNSSTYAKAFKSVMLMRCDSRYAKLGQAYFSISKQLKGRNKGVGRS